MLSTFVLGTGLCFLDISCSPGHGSLNQAVRGVLRHTGCKSGWFGLSNRNTRKEREREREEEREERERGDDAVGGL